MRIILAILASLAFLASAAAQPATTAPNIVNITGNFPISKFNSGTLASNTTYWRGDGTWATPSAGTGSPGGSNTQVQYNNSGAFGGITGATTDGTTLTLVAPVLGTPTSVTLTNASGTAASLTAGHVTTNANLTGDTTSVGNATTTTKINGVDQTTAWTTYTPTVTSSGGTLTATGAYKQIGKTLFFHIVVTVTTAGTSNFVVTLPVTPINGIDMAAVARNATTGISGAGRIRDTTNMTVTRFDGVYFGANGDLISITGVYEAN